MSSVVHIQLDDEVKKQATATLDALGLTLPDAVSLFLKRIASEQAMPFEFNIPNAKTIEAIEELEAGEGEHFDTIKALLTDLNADD